MQEKIHGIVLRTLRFSDHKQIADLFTLEHGRMSFVAPVGQGKRRTTASAFWRPLSILEFEADLHGQNRLAHPRDVRISQPYADLPYNPRKAPVALFLAEFLANALRAEQYDRPLYQYLENALLWLDNAKEAYANFHLVFLIHLMHFAGIYPNLENPAPGAYFDMQSGTYAAAKPLHPNYLPPAQAELLPTILRMNYANMSRFRLSRRDRQQILQHINTYFRLHLPPFPELRSLQVLQEVFDQ